METVLVLGASYSGARCAELLSQSLPPTHRVLLIDRQTHFNRTFTFPYSLSPYTHIRRADVYIFPRLSVLPNHSHKAFVPYSRLLSPRASQSTIPIPAVPPPPPIDADVKRSELEDEEERMTSTPNTTGHEVPLLRLRHGELVRLLKKKKGGGAKGLDRKRVWEWTDDSTTPLISSSTLSFPNLIPIRKEKKEEEEVPKVKITHTSSSCTGNCAGCPCSSNPNPPLPSTPTGNSIGLPTEKIASGAVESSIDEEVTLTSFSSSAGTTLRTSSSSSSLSSLSSTSAIFSSSSLLPDPSETSQSTAPSSPRHSSSSTFSRKSTESFIAPQSPTSSTVHPALWEENKEHALLRANIVKLGTKSVVLELLPDGERVEIAFSHCVLALGSTLPPVLVPPPGTTTKPALIDFLNAQHLDIQRARNVLVVGGGAAGIQYASDIKDAWPEKKVTMVHSRMRVLPEFEREVHDITMQRLEELGVEVVLGERVTIPSDGERKPQRGEKRTYVTSKGREIKDVDLLLLCTGQRPNSTLIRSSFPSSVNDSGYVKVNRHMQLVDAEGSVLGGGKVWAVGDVVDGFGAIKAGHTGWNQATICAQNILRLLQNPPAQSQQRSKPALQSYYPGVPMIRLTLGLRHSVSQIAVDGGVEVKVTVLDEPKEGEKEDTGCWRAIWRRMGWKEGEEDGDAWI
ncbi:FAD/NAD(P)-binding domain-containing protein [Atractiella rhizophila]|nr:FAD/NAD(P)-binding domain-containing protein [Atractiella rhizophila]